MICTDWLHGGGGKSPKIVVVVVISITMATNCKQWQKVVFVRPMVPAYDSFET